MPGPVKIHDLTTYSPAQRANLLKRTESDMTPFLEGVKPIIEKVRQEGDAALVHYAKAFDKAEITENTIKASAEDFDKAFETLSPDVMEAIRFAVKNIKEFHQAQVPELLRLSEARPGVFTGDRFTPIESVACYIPRGKGSFPSVVMMTTIPAAVAKVPNLFIVTPPGPDGKVDDATLVAARLAGVENVYKCGGAQAVAAVAYGTKTVPKADKIVGPGSPWLMAAKQLLADLIQPGTPAGPSESIVLADSTANPHIAALDLIIESEHGPDSSAFLITPSREVAEKAARAIPEYWEKIGPMRTEYSSTVLTGEKGGIVLTRDMDQALEFINDYAPEHLEVLSSEPFQYLGKVKNAGEVLMGENTPLTLGNYLLGPNAVLPTSGAARTSSCLCVYDFLKMTSVGYVTKPAYDELAKHAHCLATYEGFEGHALAVSEERQKAFKK